MGTLFAVLLLIASIAFWNGSTEPSALPDNPTLVQSLKAMKLRVSPTSAQPRPIALASPIDAAFSVELRPEEVIGDIECNMKVGRGRASDSAVVLLPTFDGARFSVLDSDGALASGSLPFRPHIVELGMQLDGTPVLGFADLRLNSKVFRDADASEPVRILVGDQIVYESDNDQALRGTWRVTKRRFDAATGSIDEVWSRTLDLRSFGGDMFASDNGRWLVVDGWDFHVLDTDCVLGDSVLGGLRERGGRLAYVSARSSSNQERLR